MSGFHKSGHIYSFHSNAIIMSQPWVIFGSPGVCLMGQGSLGLINVTQLQNWCEVWHNKDHTLGLTWSPASYLIFNSFEGMYIATYILTYIHTYIHTYVHTLMINKYTIHNHNKHTLYIHIFTYYLEDPIRVTKQANLLVFQMVNIIV